MTESASTSLKGAGYRNCSMRARGLRGRSWRERAAPQNHYERRTQHSYCVCDAPFYDRAGTADYISGHSYYK
jgi:hypothetical protein